MNNIQSIALNALRTLLSGEDRNAFVFEAPRQKTVKGLDSTNLYLHVPFCRNHSYEMVSVWGFRKKAGRFRFHRFLGTILSGWDRDRPRNCTMSFDSTPLTLMPILRRVTATRAHALLKCRFLQTWKRSIGCTGGFMKGDFRVLF